MGLFRQEYWSGLPFSSSGGSFWPRDWAHVCFISCIAGGFSTHWATGRNVYILLKYGFLWPRSSVVESYLFLVFLRNYQRATTVLKCLVAYVVVVQSLSCVLYFVILWTAAHQAFLSFTISWCCRNQTSRNQAPHSENWRTQVYYTGGPRGVNTPSSKPHTKGLQSFIHGQAWLSGFTGAGQLQRAGQGWVR